MQVMAHDIKFRSIDHLTLDCDEEEQNRFSLADKSAEKG